MTHDSLPVDQIDHAAAPLRVQRAGRVAGWLALVVLLWLAWCGIRVAVSGRLALQDVQHLRQAAAAPTLQSLGPLAADVTALDVHLRGVQAAGRPFWWVLAHLGWLPRFGTDLQAVPPLLNMAVALAGAGHRSLDALAPLTAVLAESGKGELLARAVPALALAAPQLAPVEADIAQVEAWRAQIKGPRDPRLIALLARVDQALPLIRPGLQAVRLLPDLLGANGPRTYLILAQNNDELRATGGFISGAGIVKLDRGRIVDLRMADSYTVDDLANPHPAAPKVFAEQMGAQMLLLRDSNWSPDFPTSAQVARSLYEQDQGVATDGAIALDLEAVRLLTGALGPLIVPGRPEPVTGDNVIAQMKQAWDAPAGDPGGTGKTADWWLKRKDFMGPLMVAALARVQSGGDLQAGRLATALLDMLAGRHLQIAVDDPQAAALVAAQGWDGALRLPANGDFLAVVDSNLGYNKANAAVTTALDYRVVMEDGTQGPAATVTLTYRHTAPAIQAACERAPYYGDSYNEMTDRCYWDYVRVYVPANSVMLSTAGLDGAGSEAGEQGTLLVTGNLVLRPGESRRVTIRYRLPPSAAVRPYRLFVRAQAGTAGWPLAVQAGACQWQSDLSRDRTFECDR